MTFPDRLRLLVGCASCELGHRCERCRVIALAADMLDEVLRGVSPELLGRLQEVERPSGEANCGCCYEQYGTEWYYTFATCPRHSVVWGPYDVGAT